MLEFTQIYNRLRPDLFEGGQYVRGGTEGGKLVYYAHASLPDSFVSDAAVERRKRKYVEGARIVKDALSKQYGDSVTDEVLLKVGEAVHRDLAQGVTRGDLDLLHEELHRPETLQNRAKNDETAEVIKERLAGGWLFAAIDPRSPVRWLDSDTEVELRPSVHEKCLRHSKMHFSEQGTLTLTQGERGDGEANKSALTKFIGRHFKVASGDPVAPGQPEFQNIANNVLSYLPLLGQYVVAKMHRVAGGGVCSSVDDAKGTFTLSVKENGNIGVAGGTNIRFRMGDDAVSRFDWSKYRFVRQEDFEISGDQLRSDQFNPKASLVSVDRFDTVELAD